MACISTIAVNQTHPGHGGRGAAALVLSVFGAASKAWHQISQKACCHGCFVIQRIMLQCTALEFSCLHRACSHLEVTIVELHQDGATRGVGQQAQHACHLYGSTRIDRSPRAGVFRERSTRRVHHHSQSTHAALVVVLVGVSVVAGN